MNCIFVGCVKGVKPYREGNTWLTAFVETPQKGDHEVERGAQVAFSSDVKICLDL